MKKIILVIFIFFGSLHIANASELFFDFPDKINIGDVFEVEVKLDTGGVSMNSLALIIDYPDNLVEFSGYKEEGSVIRMWLETPKVSSSGKIKLSGIIPGGVEGYYDPNSSTLKPLSIIKLMFTSKKAGNGEFSFDYSSVLANDGKGSEIPYNKIPKSISIDLPNDAYDQENNFIDKDLPEPFEISLVKSNHFSKTPAMLVFSTTDLSSGVDRYEMYKRGQWRIVESPMSIQESLFSRKITIRAIDYNGNVRESKIAIDGKLPDPLLLAVLIVGWLAFCIFMCFNKKIKR